MANKNENKQKYIYDEDKNIIGVENEKHEQDFYLSVGNNLIRVLVTKEKEYYNFYIIDEWFKQEPLNNLHLQEELKYWEMKSIKEKEQFLTEIIFNHYLWFKFNKFKFNKSFSITSEDL